MLESYCDHLVTVLMSFFREYKNRRIQRANRLLMSKMRSCGNNACLYGRVFISGVEYMELGENATIAENAFIRADAGLKIGDNTHISRNLTLYTINHDYTGVRLPYDHNMIKKPVTIGRNVWIGMNVCIAPGTTIGDGVIVGMGTTVSGEVPALCIIGGQKWAIIGRRDEEHYQRCVAEGAYGDTNGSPLPIARNPRH